VAVHGGDAREVVGVGSCDSVAAPSSNRYPEHLVNASSSEPTATEPNAAATGGGTSRRRGRCGGGLPRKAGAATARGWRRSIRRLERRRFERRFELEKNVRIGMGDLRGVGRDWRMGWRGSDDRRRAQGRGVRWDEWATSK
jgi:hypothetical protein